MDKEILSYIVKKTNELINCETCSNEAKTAAQSWLDSVGTENEVMETKKYINELEADIMQIDILINFAKSEESIKYFGEDTAKNIAQHAEEIKANGAKYCDCPACEAAKSILEKKNLLLK